MDVCDLGHPGQSLVQLSGQSLATGTQHGHPEVEVAGQQDVASSRLWWVGGDDGGLNGVEDEGYSEVDVGDHQQDVVIIQN